LVICGAGSGGQAPRNPPNFTSELVRFETKRIGMFVDRMRVEAIAESKGIISKE